MDNVSARSKLNFMLTTIYFQLEKIHDNNSHNYQEFPTIPRCSICGWYRPDTEFHTLATQISLELAIMSKLLREGTDEQVKEVEKRIHKVYVYFAQDSPEFLTKFYES